jgi:hypothetical protein
MISVGGRGHCEGRLAKAQPFPERRGTGSLEMEAHTGRMTTGKNAQQKETELVAYRALRDRLEGNGPAQPYE